jgi:crotonobetainyl-CoA:carnitine CoA-transferase CaiB-like acyl-CoA transferase
MPERQGLLSDVTVVAIEQAVSAPFCSRTLADFGARVIKIENPIGGDFTRGYDDVANVPACLAPFPCSPHCMIVAARGAALRRR